jgi:plastocyanin
MKSHVGLFYSLLLASVLYSAPIAGATPQGMDVQAQIKMTHRGIQKGSNHRASSTVVLWLSEVPYDSGRVVSPPQGHFRMAQKNKGFSPHLLVVPLGSTVEFPNLDPFFHNVFSQFNGKRFDLGLYEAGSTKGVRFDHEGVSYIFCNIHPEMAAVIVTLSTPYFSISADDGHIVLHDVPPGTYEMHIWVEGSDAKQLDTITRRVHIAASQTDLGTINLVTNDAVPAHKNKFDEDYRPDASTTY